MAIGSPGTTRNNTNTMTATPIIVIAAMPNRCNRPEVILGPPPESRSAGLLSRSALPFAQPLETSVGCNAPVPLATTFSDDL